MELLISDRGSEEWKRRVNVSKQRTLASKFNWDLARPYMDTCMDNGSRNRTSKFMTFRTFKELVDRGYSLSNMSVDLKYSKHLVAFMSNFLQGKVAISSVGDIATLIESGLVTDADRDLLRGRLDLPPATAGNAPGDDATREAEPAVSQA